MIEYLYDAIRATAGEEMTIAAEIVDVNGYPVERGCHFTLYNGTERMAAIDGELNADGVWEFTIPADTTDGLNGRYWYCICTDETHNKLNFKQPIYFI